MGDALQLGRAAFDRRAWTEAFEQLNAAELSHPDDLERLAVAANLLGRDDASEGAWDRAYAACTDRGDPARAARCAFWLALGLMLRGEEARGGGWVARAERLADEAGECAAAGLVLTPRFLGALSGGDADTALALATEMVELARRIDDRELLALGLLSTGQAEFLVGRTGPARKAFDEAMVLVTHNEVSPVLAGIVYCAVIDSCMTAGDLRRAAQWTDALQRWCADQPDLVPYRGQCLVHRSQVLTAHGEWSEASTAADLACRRLSEPPHPAIGLAFYQHGDLHRLRGDFDAAEEAYKDAGRHGKDPVPGFALLRLAQRNVEAAAAAANRMVAEHRGAGVLAAPVLAAAVEILVVSGEVDSARALTDELIGLTRGSDLPLVQATVAFASGSLLLATDDAPGSLTAFRRACNLWHELEVPYEEARARVGVSRACAALGDLDACALELEAARAIFTRLGAGPDLERLDAPQSGSGPAGGLTERECEVLRQVASGQTNRQIATELSISEHTVARHLQNIFLKLGLTSRAAATAYAYEHHIV
ncbi:MAG TPA: helix-turn-helix transcriptional regulator [Microthrixaceae bacterium]|nr:helix-turn-helix transcriptional regulator [Microthrixaceae bacterium]